MEGKWEIGGEKGSGTLFVRKKGFGRSFLGEKGDKSVFGCFLRGERGFGRGLGGKR